MTFLLRRLERKQASYANLAAQVAHDIRSPINTLNHLASTNDLESETNQVLLRKTIERLQFIVSDLIEKRSDGFSQEDSAPKMSAVQTKEQKQGWINQVQSLIEEKKALHSQFKGRRIDLVINASGDLPAGYFEPLIRSLSNLLDNSIEAIGLAGDITLTVSDVNNQLEFKIKDSGPGVPEEILSQIGQPKFSFGKTDGSGMGVYLAKKFTLDSGGSFKFESVVGLGSTVTMRLPAQGRSTDIKFAVLDDDPLAHAMWKLQIQDQSPRLNLESFSFFSQSQDLQSWLNQPQKGELRLFVDYDLKEPRTGLQLIKDLGVEDLSVLVTNSFDDPHVKAEAASAGIRVFPKSAIDRALLDCR